VPVIERAASSKGVGWQEIRLSPYGEADARDYLEWRFQQAKYRGRIPFTDQQVRELFRLSAGLPGKLNQMANVLLVKLETGEASVARATFPRLHGALLALLVALVALLYVLFERAPPDLETVALDVPAIAAEGTPGDEAAPDLQTPTRAQERTQEAAAALDASATAGAEPTAAAPEEDAPAARPSGQAAMPEETAAVTAEPEPPSGDVSAVEVGEDDTADAAGPEADAAEPAQAVVAPAPPAPAAEPAAVGRSARDTAWLLEQNPDYFTLQLVTLSALDRAEAFVAKQQDPAEFVIYQLPREGRVLHVVLYGLFSSREAAEAAADHLPPEIGQVQPWIRPVAQVQSAARLASRR
jgi:DamX protein